MSTVVIISFKGARKSFDTTGISSGEDFLATILSVFKLNRDSRIVLVRVVDGVIVLPTPQMAAGDYTMEVPDDGLGDLKRKATFALVVAPFLVLYYRIILPAMLSGLGDD